MNYIFELDKFEGPLDLLLHLIKESSIDIVDIKIENITKQYLDYIQKIKDLNLDVASEYLVMAAELIEIKSKILLPNVKLEENDEYEDDPREALIRKLLMYKNYKETTVLFRELEIRRKKFYDKPISNITLEKNIPDDLTLDTLKTAFTEMLKRIDEKKPINTRVIFKEYSVVKRSNEIKDLINKNKKIRFIDLFDICSRDYVIVTFLAMLDLACKQELRIEQECNFKDIILCSKEEIV